MPQFRFLFRFYLALVGVFIAAKPVFMLLNGAIGRGITISETFDVLLHGLPLDLSTAAYLSAPFGSPSVSRFGFAYPGNAGYTIYI